MDYFDDDRKRDFGETGEEDLAEKVRELSLEVKRLKDLINISGKSAQL